MKKLYTTSEYKKRNERKIKFSYKERIRRKKNRLSFSHSIHNPYITLESPVNFSFIENPIDIVNFIEEIDRFAKRKRNVILNFSEITNLTPDAITLLLFYLKDKKNYLDNNKLKIKVKLPEEETFKKLFLSSTLSYYLVKGTGGIKTDKSLTFEKSYDMINGDHIIEIRKFVSEKLLGKDTVKMQNVIKVLLECMCNTRQHASKSKKKTEKWKLFITYDDIKKKVTISFIDFGVGIFKSLESKFNLKSFSLKFRKNNEIMKDLLLGTIASSTGLPYRGKGFPTMYQQCETYKNINKLNIISNNVHADVSKKVYSDLHINFSGTFIYFEIKKENISKNGNIANFS